MFVRTTRVAIVALLLSSPVLAQHGGVAPQDVTAPAEAKQFAFMIGQFDLVVKPAATTLAMKIHGVPKLVGTWKGWRALDGFGIEDELRITDEAGNPKTLSHAVRFYDVTQKRWMTSALDVYRGVFSTSNGEWKDNGMTMMSHGSDGDGKNYVSRTRYTDITPAGFKFRQERSYDEGKTWDASLTIEAKRVAATVAR